MDFFFRGVDQLIAEIPGEDKATHAVLQASTHTDVLTRAAPIIKMRPNLDTSNMLTQISIGVQLCIYAHHSYVSEVIPEAEGALPEPSVLILYRIGPIQNFPGGLASDNAHYSAGEETALVQTLPSLPNKVSEQVVLYMPRQNKCTGVVLSELQRSVKHQYSLKCNNQS